MAIMIFSPVSNSSNHPLAGEIKIIFEGKIGHPRLNIKISGKV